MEVKMENMERKRKDKQRETMREKRKKKNS